MQLRYRPHGDPQETGRWLPGIPADDFDCEDEALAERLIASGLYAAVADAPEQGGIPKAGVAPRGMSTPRGAEPAKSDKEAT